MLLITTGSTPQIVTETLHALMTASPAWVPDRILLATTGHGARLFREGQDGAALLGPGGKLEQLANACGLPALAGRVEILVPEANGAPLADIRSQSEVSAFAELLLREVAAITTDDGTELHVSLAGGRKTMSFLAGQIMSLCGRPQDRLSHVLVEPATLEAPGSGFWWPGDGSAGAEQARVLLHDAPFLRVRAWMGDALPDMARSGYANAVAMANDALADAGLDIDLVQRCIRVGGHQLGLPAQQLAALALAAIAARRGQTLRVERDHRRIALDGDALEAAQLWAWLHSAATLDQIYDGDALVHFGAFDAAAERAAAEVMADYDQKFAPPVSRLKAALKKNLPPTLAGRLLMKRHLGLATGIRPDRIRLIGPADLHDHPGRPPEVESAAG